MEQQTETSPFEAFMKILMPSMIAFMVVICAPLFCKPDEWATAIVLSIAAGLLTYVFMDQFPM